MFAGNFKCLKTSLRIAVGNLRTCSTVQRRLGFLEKQFFKDQKIIPSMLLLSCRNPVTPFQVHSALETLLECHPFLRMTISGDIGTAHFSKIEKLRIQVNTSSVETLDWFKESRDLYEKLDILKPLWKFIWIQNSFNEKNNLFQFIFSIHHSVVDFPYARLIIMDFLDIVSDMQNGDTEKQYKKYSIEKPIEEILKIGKNESERETAKISQQTISSIDAYEYYYKNEIQSLKNSKRIKCTSLFTKFDENVSTIFFTKCKNQLVSRNSAILAALLLSFGNLLMRKGCKDMVKFEFSFMINLRRYSKDDFYPGMAAAECPVSITYDLAKTNLRNDFWVISKEIQDAASEAINNGKPLQIIHDNMHKLNGGERRIQRKLKYVFRLSNVDRNDFLRPETGVNFEIKDFQVITDIKMDNSPIFLMLSSILKGCFYCGIGFSSNYTSSNTAKIFLDEFTAVIHSSIEN